MQNNNEEASTLTEKAVSKLRYGILSGVLEPGRKLRIDDLRANYGFGSSPLREALSRLVSSGLVTAEGQKGFRVAPISKQDLRDITNTRILLEKAALSDSLEKGGVDWEENVAATYNRLNEEHERLQRNSGASVDAWEEANREFHEALVSACNSHWILNFRQIIYDQAVRYRRFVALDEEQERGAHIEHSQMFDAATQRDIQKICELAEAHAERSYNLTANRFAD